MLMMVGSALLLNVQLTIVKLLTEAGWPDLTINAVSCFLTASCCAFRLATTCPPMPKAGEMKWVLLAGMFFSGSFVLMLLAVRLGISIGDFAALNSANVVFAAFLGRVFLRELMHWAHFGAVFCTVVGALLISRPQFLFGGSSDGSAVGHGHILALASGVCDACIYVSSRRLEGCSPWLLNMSFTGQSSIVLFLLAGLSGTTSLDSFVASPAEGLGWLAAIFVPGMVSMVLFTAAAQACPAALSATVDTATRMMSGYLATALFFTAPIDAFTVVGASLMFVSVVTMAFFQAPAPPEEAAAERGDVVAAEAGGGAAAADDDETESLASFIATECVGVSESLRLRRPGGSVEPVGKIIGAVASAAGVAVSA